MKPRLSRLQRGSVFVISLILMAGLVALVVSVAATQQLAATAAVNRTEKEQARLAAESGIQYALSTLTPSSTQTPGASNSLQNTTTSSTANSTTATTQQDDWYQLGQQGDTLYTIGSQSFRVQVIDSSSLLDINTATEQQLDRLPLTQEQIDSILDFRSAATNSPHPDGGQDDYYNSLPTPYNAKEGKFDTIDELLQVRGFSADVLYNPQTNVSAIGGQMVTGKNGQQPILYDLLGAYCYSPNTDPNGNAKVNVNRTNVAALSRPPLSLPPALATLISQRRNWTRIGDILALQGAQSQTVQKSIIDYLTTSGSTRIEGKLNLNTVTESVLDSIPQLTPDLVQAILNRQAQGFTSLSDLLSVPGFSGNILNQTIDLFSVASRTFVVRCVGKVGQTTVSLEALVDTTSGTPKIISIQEPPYNDMTERWYWQDQASTETDLQGAP